MSYDICLKDPVTREVIILNRAHHLRGGTYAVGGTKEAWINVTYNYAPLFRQTIDEEKGIRFIYGMTGAASLPILRRAAGLLGDDVDDDDYWSPTEGNVKRAILKLTALAEMCPDGIWDGD